MSKHIRHSYYQCKPAWCSADSIKGSSIGIELEVEASGGGSYRHVLNLLPDFAKSRNPFCITDGTLSGMSGVEIIFPPTKPGMLLSKKSVFRRSIEAIEHSLQKGITHAGMHFNVNAKTWAPRAIDTFLITVNYFDKAMLEKLGGRKLTSYCRQKKYAGYSLSNAVYNRSDVTSAHAWAAEWKYNRIECRFPVSTTDQERIGYIIDFCTLLEKFSRDHTPAGETAPSKIPAMFIKYLSRRKKGKALVAYMAPPTATKEVTTNASPATNPPSQQTLPLGTGTAVFFTFNPSETVSSVGHFVDPRSIFFGP